jgi:hypothetical protein
MAAETGSGKTLAYGAPILSKLLFLKEKQPGAKGEHISNKLPTVTIFSIGFDTEYSLEGTNAAEVDSVGREHLPQNFGADQRRNGNFLS